MATFGWTDETKKAAQLVAEGELSQNEIAAQLGVTRQTVWNWRKSPEFEARVEEIIEDVRASLRRRAISQVERRVDRLNRDWLRLQRVMDERAASPEMQAAPGGDTGTMVRKLKSLGAGENATVVEEFEVDTGLLKELREIEKQAAQELGQWTERTAIEDARKSYETANSPDTL